METATPDMGAPIPLFRDSGGSYCTFPWPSTTPSISDLQANGSREQGECARAPLGGMRLFETSYLANSGLCDHD